MTSIVSSPQITQFRARLPPSTQYLQVSFRQFIPKVSPRRIYGVARDLAHASKNRGILRAEVLIDQRDKHVHRHGIEAVIRSPSNDPLYHHRRRKSARVRRGVVLSYEVSSDLWLAQTVQVTSKFYSFGIRPDFKKNNYFFFRVAQNGKFFNFLKSSAQVSSDNTKEPFFFLAKLRIL